MNSKDNKKVTLNLFPNLNIQRKPLYISPPIQ